MDRLIYRGKTYGGDAGNGGLLTQAGAYVSSPLCAETLGVDTLTAVVRDYGLQPRLLAADGLPVFADGRPAVARCAAVGLDASAQYGESVEYYHDEVRLGKFRLNSLQRVGRYEYQLDCISAIGLLLTGQHYGGVYDGETAGTVIADIIRGTIPYTLDADLAAVPVYGVLPKGTRRDNLRNVLFAVGGQIRKDTAGEVSIVPMSQGAAYALSEDEIYTGGSVTGGTPATGVAVTEHSFVRLPGDEIITLYDGEAAAAELVTPNGAVVSGVLVDFSEPMYDLEGQNTSILEWGANYAVISGSPAAVLTGRKYTHTERILLRTVLSGGAANVVESSECQLVNLMNSELVADRLMAYYGAAKTYEADLVVTDQKPGDYVSFTDPFGDAATGFIADMELTMSAILKAHTTIISGYIPTAWGNYYTAVAKITQSGTFTVPSGCRGKIRIVLIQGGSGGYAGEPGGAGTAGSTSGFGTSGEGGAGGAGGSPGRVYVGTIAAQAGNTFAVVIGTGGAGAAESGEAPGEGGHSTFGAYSSADGFVPDEGYAALLTDDIYALPGETGTPGGAGMQGEDTGFERPTVTFDGETWTAGAMGETASTGSVVGCGGLGGGAAVGADGGDGENGAVSSYNGGYLPEGGDGGDGATPAAAPDTDNPGQGGHGGHGGGGAGGGGSVSSGIWVGAPGTPGSGGQGGTGGPGLVLVYY